MLTVLAPAASYDLVSLSDAKSALSITGSDQDAKIATWIDQASAAISTYCGRVFAVEQVEEVIRPSYGCVGLVLARFPVISIASIIEGEATLTSDDYEANLSSGTVDRIWSNRYACWSRDPVVVTYTAGFASIPADVQRACIVTLQHIQSNAGRDMTLRSSATTDILSESWFAPSSDALPPEVASLVAPYRVPNSR